MKPSWYFEGERRSAPWYIAGLDLGQAQDYTALAIAEVTKVETMEGWWREFAFRHLQRWPLGTAYTTIAEDLAEMLAKLPDEPTLVVDATGCGRPILDLIRCERLPVQKLVPVVITGGHQPTSEGGFWHAPKRDLAGAVQAALQGQRLHVAPALREAPVLSKELQTFRVKVNIATGNESFEAWRERDHDDLVLAVALAVWWGDHCQRRLNLFA
jgi:hypothetical protein